MSSALAASVIFRPPKKRSVTSLAACGERPRAVPALVDGEHVFGWLGSRDGGFVQLFAASPASVFDRLAAPGLIDQDAAHRLSGSGEKMAPAGPVLSLLSVHQPHIGFMDQGSRLNRSASFLVGQSSRRQLTQLEIDQRQELLGNVRVSCFNGG